MGFKRFCLVVMGDTKNIFTEIENISEGAPNILNSKGNGLVISTFVSMASIKELEEWFSYNNRSFLVFELDKSTCGYFITNKDIYNKLFTLIDDDELDEKNEIFSNVVNIKIDNNTISLEEELENAIKNEDYEQAIILRDKIANNENK